MQTAVQIEYEEKHEGSLNKEQKFFHESQSMPSSWSSPSENPKNISTYRCDSKSKKKYENEMTRRLCLLYCSDHNLRYFLIQNTHCVTV